MEHVTKEMVKTHWDNQAEKYKTKKEATLGDPFLRDVECEHLLRLLKAKTKVLDCGCGNGTSTIYMSKRKELCIQGIDFSEKMIEYANENLLREPNLRNLVNFKLGDVLDLDYDCEFDYAITMRCIQNLVNADYQKKAIKNMIKSLRLGGFLYMLENSAIDISFLSGIFKFLPLREKIIPVWHNLPISKNVLKLWERDCNYKLLKTQDVNGAYLHLMFFTPSFLHNLIKNIIIKFPFSCLGYAKIFILQKNG